MQIPEQRKSDLTDALNAVALGHKESKGMNIQDDMTCYRVYFEGFATPYLVWATDINLAKQMAKRDYAHLCKPSRIGVA